MKGKRKKTFNKIESVKEFTQRIRKAKSTVYRFYEKNEELWLETKLKNRKRYIPLHHDRYFNSEIMYDENKLLMQENKSMRNLIDQLMDKDSLPSTFWYLDWSFFVTVAYKAERNQTSCFRQMHALYDYLVEMYGERTEIRIFFSTEPFTDRKGYHNHLTLYLSNEKLHDTIMKEVEEFFSFDRVGLKPYDQYKAGLFYIAKEGLHLEDWDIMFEDDRLRKKVDGLLKVV
ncbi:hypothetical protein ACFLR1_07000 [Bacteroidota bacterium]